MHRRSRRVLLFGQHRGRCRSRHARQMPRIPGEDDLFRQIASGARGRPRGRACFIFRFPNPMPGAFLHQARDASSLWPYPEGILQLPQQRGRALGHPRLGQPGPRALCGLASQLVHGEDDARILDPGGDQNAGQRQRLAEPRGGRVDDAALAHPWPPRRPGRFAGCWMGDRDWRGVFFPPERALRVLGLAWGFSSSPGRSAALGAGGGGALGGGEGVGLAVARLLGLGTETRPGRRRPGHRPARSSAHLHHRKSARRRSGPLPARLAGVPGDHKQVEIPTGSSACQKVNMATFRHVRMLMCIPLR